MVGWEALHWKCCTFIHSSNAPFKLIIYNRLEILRTKGCLGPLQYTDQPLHFFMYLLLLNFWLSFCAFRNECLSVVRKWEAVIQLILVISTGFALEGSFIFIVFPFGNFSGLLISPSPISRRFWQFLRYIILTSFKFHHTYFTFSHQLLYVWMFVGWFTGLTFAVYK